MILLKLHQLLLGGLYTQEKMKNRGNETFFDLQGRRVAQPTKGLYIVNGKKIVVR